MKRLSLALPAAALALVAGCSLPAASTSGLSNLTGTAGPTRFEVSGSGGAQNVTWGVNGNQSQESDVSLPWSKEVPADGGFTVASLVAQNTGSGSVTCRITRDGKVLAEQTSKGKYAVVTCSG